MSKKDQEPQGTQDAPKEPAPAPAPKETVFQRACKAFGLDPAKHVLSSKTDGEEITIVTNGGKKLRWPEDAAVKLTDADKDGVPRDTPHRDMSKKAAAARAAGQE